MLNLDVTKRRGALLVIMLVLFSVVCLMPVVSMAEGPEPPNQELPQDTTKTIDPPDGSGGLVVDEYDVIDLILDALTGI